MRIIQKLLETLKFEHEYTAPQDSSPSANIVAIVTDKRTLVLAGYALIVSVLTYWFDLTDFPFSIDEGHSMFEPNIWAAFCRQERWAWAILQYLLPHQIGALPFLPTAFCCITFSFAASIFATVATNNRLWQLLFVALFVSCPIFPHSVEFGINSMAVGLCVLFSLLAAGCLLDGQKKMTGIGCILVTMAIGFYQSAVFLFVTATMLLLLVKRRSWRDYIMTCACAAVAVVASTLAGIGMRKILNFPKASYPASLVDIEQIIPSLGKSALKVVKIVFGTDTLFLNVGVSSLLIIYVSLLISCLSFLKKRRWPELRTIVLSLSAFGSAVLIIFIITANAPVRAMTALSVLYAFTGASAAQLISHKRLIGFIAIISILTNIYISTSLFYSDTITRERDMRMATSIISRMQEVEPQLGLKKVKFTILGKYAHEHFGIAQRSEIFGYSYFELTDFPEKQEHLFRYLGVKKLIPVEFSSKIAKDVNFNIYPSWPEKGSIFYHDNILMIKLGELTSSQRKSIGLQEEGIIVTKPKIQGEFVNILKNLDVKSLEILPKLKPSNIESCSQDGGMRKLRGWAFSEKEGKIPDSYFFLEKRENKWEILPIWQNLKLNRQDVERVLEDETGRLSGYEIRIADGVVKANFEYRLVAYFHNSKNIYLVPISENQKRELIK